MTEDYDDMFKICIVGDPGIGREIFVESFAPGFHTEDSRMTIGVDFHVKIITLDTQDRGPLKIKLQVWDTGWEQKFNSIRPMYFRGASGFILLFDLANRDSFLHLTDYITTITEVKERRKREKKRNVPILLVGNISDPESFAISPKQFDDFIRKYKLPYMETSTITKEGIIDSFYGITSLIVGADIHSEYFISEKTDYHPSIASPPTSPSISTLTPQDIHNLTQRIIALEEKLDQINQKEEKKDFVHGKVKQPSDVGHKVFICYSSKDKDVADATCHFLEQQGIRCWIAPRDVSAGSYAWSIAEAIEKSKLMVLIFTNNANFSNHVKRELELAVSNGLTIQPIRIESVEPTPELKYYISSMHWLDALTPPIEEHLSKLAQMVSKLLEAL